jgi:signal transduction histidine kinase/CheY-like chemotaxis protein
VVDGQLRLVAWNARYAALFDYPPELLAVGTPVEALVRHNAARGLLGPGATEELVARRLAHMRAGTPYVTERTLADGSVIEIRGNPMPGGGFVATFTDVTPFRAAEQALKLANETLEQRVAERTAESEAARAAAERADRAKSRFLAAVSHDLVQPLNAAHLFTHALAQQSAGQAHAAAVAEIDSALTSTEQLLAAILDISRLDAGGLTPAWSRFALDELLGPLLAEARALAAARGVRIDHVPTRLHVHSDPRLLRRIVQNFLSNAVRYCRRGRVLVGARRRGGAVVIEVWDTGPGIAEADREVIFEEFRRLEAGTGVQGLGLGLSIAERIARLLGHPIGLRSTPGRGSCFAVTVPRAVAADVLAPAAADATLSRTGATLRGRAVVVDNDAAAAQALGEVLAGWGLAVERAADAAGFGAAIAARRPDVCLLDFHLDGAVTALDLLPILRMQAGDVPVIVVTADHGAEVRAAVEQAGCLLLLKPVKPLALRSVLNRVLGARVSG